MTWQPNIYAFLLLAAIIPVLGLILIAWRYRNRQAAFWFIIFTLAVIGFMASYGLELLSPTLPQMMIFLRLEYIFSLSLPVIYLLFVLAYSGYDSWLTRSNMIALFVIPAIHLLAVWTNEYHGLNWKTVGTETVDGLVLFTRTYGTVFWIGTIYLYMIAAVATAMLIISIGRYSKLYRGQIVPLILGITAVWASNVLTVTKTSPLASFDLTPFGYAVVSVFFAWSLFRYRLFDIMPAVHDVVIKGMTDAVIVTDAQSRVIDLNPVAERLLSVNAAEAVGQPAKIAFARVPELIIHALDHDIHDEITLNRGDSLQTYDRRISTLYDRSNALIGCVTVLHDVTQLKQAEATARKYARELEERNSELDAFGHTIAHDLKNPLALIYGFTELLMDMSGTDMSPLGHEYAEIMQKTAAKMNEMVSELLQLASVRDVGSVIEKIDMNRVVRAALDRLRMDIAQRGIQIEIKPDMPAALGHALWVEEVFANLISNAIKYIGKDNPSPHIAIGAVTQEGFVRYEVKDNGLGIDEHSQAELFEMFARFHRNEASGLGLGLSIVMRIVKRLNGHIGVESSPGKGSTFWFTLPAPQAE